MSDPWTFTGETVAIGTAGSTVTLVEGSAFAISSASGDMTPGTAEGLFFRDTRFLSRLQLKINGQVPETLAMSPTDPFSARFVGRVRPRPGRADSTILITRSRYVGRGMRDDLVVRNFGDEPAYCAVQLAYGADFADLFEVKEGRAVSHVGDEDYSSEHAGGSLVFRHRRGSHGRGIRISFSVPAHLDANLASFEVIIPARDEWTLCQQFTCSIEGESIEPRWLCGQPVERAKPAERMAQWRRSVPYLDTDHDGLRMVVAKSAEDLGALRIFDPDFPERTVVAAGAPWFMTLFGRDSLITSWMALLVDPDLALGVLQTLARFQGSQVDPKTEEEPGRILHEMRFGDSPSLSLGGGKVYYGTADATPLFVMLLGELRRWGLAKEAVDELLPHADRAIGWIENFGDRDGDGYVEYLRTSDRGLANQGWKDSHDGVRFADGRIAQAPIALCEVQGYVYGAYLARAYFAGEQGDPQLATDLRRRAAKLKANFNRDFWLADKGWLAMGLDKDKRPIDALTSNMGHCLWTGILDADKASMVAKRLLSHDMFTGWGVRTLAASMAGYNPISYHCGSVWPHDNAIVAAGLMRYGFVREAQRVIMGMLDAAVAQGGRLPELFSGLDRLEMPTIVAYPTSCSPQAWAAASPLLMLRTLLRLDPWVPRGKVWLHPALPDQIERLRVSRIPLAGARVSVLVEGEKVDISGLPPDLELVDAPRHPLTGS
ncbi:MAG TPA: glycogen debranching N-terminal domain-containing protein [Acidimicrobiales bacterium]|nr:glycogen debranching N-terminal domain-containing protein [Acidimicrobiales bacterium]